MKYAVGWWSHMFSDGQTQHVEVAVNENGELESARWLSGAHLNKVAFNDVAESIEANFDLSGRDVTTFANDSDFEVLSALPPWASPRYR